MEENNVPDMRPTFDEIRKVDDNGKETVYEHKTDAEYLYQALEEIDDLTVEGEEGQYGMILKKVNGVYAYWEENDAYWALYVNDEYGNNSVDQQPVYDGDSFAIKYEAGM